MQRRQLLQTLLATASVGIPSICRGTAASVADLQALADQAGSSGAFPGFQIAVLAGRRLLWSTAQGLADASTGQAATEDTGYYIASTTKCFTALAAAQRAARGELDMQATLARLLPQAAWRPSLQAERITLRELLTHTHGIDADSVPAQLRVNFSGVYRDNAELLGWLAQATPASGGKTFDYSNMGYDLAAMAMAPVGRDGWKLQVQREVLDPLTLKRTSPWRSKLDAKTLAAPHADSPQGWRALSANKQDSNMGPAGGMFATAGDLARLIQVLLDGGRLDGRSVLSREVLDPMLNLQVVQNRKVLGYQRFGHSLGFDMARLHGQEILTRLGSFRGASSHLSFMPAQGLGVAFLTNGDAVAGMAGEQLLQSVYRCLLGEPAAARQMLSEGLKQALQVQSRMRTAPPPAPASDWPLPPAALVGRYSDAQLGELDLVWTGQALRARWGVLDSELTLRFPEKLQWRVDWSGRGILVDVLSDSRGRVTGLKMFGQELQRQLPPSADAIDPAPGPASAGTRG
ncbi:MAG: serine hydrolase [Betaproteobacteria bacterium]|nr:serine hydrolase [Betaproteobacteria bacterium]